MRVFSTIISIAALFLCTASTVFAQAATTVNFDSGSHLLYSTLSQNSSSVLSAGNQNVAGDGNVLRLGYYSQATAGNLFAGVFIPLSGQGTANTAYSTTSIGDDPSSGAGAGTFALSLNFFTNSPTMGRNLPAAAQILAIQFYNGTTLSNSTMYNAVSAPSWLFLAPNDPPATVTLSLDDSGVTFFGGSYYTSIPAPEPGAATGIAASIALYFCLRLVRRQPRTKAS